MKLSLNWLKEYVDITATPQELAEKLTLAGFEVERIDFLDKGLERVVVGEIKSIVKHPSADRLSLAKVNIGERTIQVVFGERAIVKAGDKIPVAVAPTNLQSREIKIAKIRGELSEGMFCLDSELKPELSDSLTYFPQNTLVGSSAATELGWDDVILDISITPNRGDCLSVLGMAREIAALYQTKLKKDPLKDFIPQEIIEGSNKHIRIAIDDWDGCYKFCAMYMKGVRAGGSPVWLKQRLASIGIRSISSIVDITNYIMMELGQPLHAFDAAKVADHFITVRKARRGEEIVPLDHKKRVLDDFMLVLADTKKVLDAAGIMGGKETEISETTTEIILVACVFKPSVIRYAYRHLGLRTESAIRFEKGIDWNLREASLLKTAQMIQELTGGLAEGGLVNVSKPDPVPVQFPVDLEYVNRLLGKKFTANEACNALGLLGIETEPIASEPGSNVFNVKIPSWRHDLLLPADIAEEIGRLSDYNTFEKLPLYGPIAPPCKNDFFVFKNKIKSVFASLGYSEVYTHSYYGDNEKDWIGESEHFEVINAISPEDRYLRSSLAPLLLQKTSANARMYDLVKLFEIGTIFKQSNALLPNEETEFTAVFSMKGIDAYQAYRMIKGDCEAFFKLIGIVGEVSYLWQGEKIGIFLGKQVIGEIMIARERDKELFKLRQEAVIFSGSARRFYELVKNNILYKPIPVFPSASRDLSFIVPKGVCYAEAGRVLQSASEYCTDIGLVDEFYLDDGSRSLTLRITLRADDRTLDGAELQKIEQRMVERARNKLALELRGEGK